MSDILDKEALALMKGKSHVGRPNSVAKGHDKSLWRKPIMQKIDAVVR